MTASSADAVVLLAALAATWAMTGLIWTIQLVHYPIFDAVESGADNTVWRRFAHRHTSTISIVVGPFMVVEGITGLWIAADPPGDVGRLLPIVALGLMAGCYGTTAFGSAPLHGRLADAYVAELHHRLVVTNWIRTVAWTARATVVAVIGFLVIT